MFCVISSSTRTEQLYFDNRIAWKRVELNEENKLYLFFERTLFCKQYFMLPVAKHPFVILPALLVLVQYPERDTDIGGDKQFPRKNDNGFHLIILNQFFANL